MNRNWSTCVSRAGGALLRRVNEQAYQGGYAVAGANIDGRDLPGPDARPNQTFGYGGGKLLTFTYTQNFDCVEQPDSDLDFNHREAQRGYTELQIPICQVGDSPTINPPGNIGNPRSTTDPLFVLVPMFSVDKDQNPNDAISCEGVIPGTLCGTTLGSTLIKLFGALPEAFKATPQVYTQCPDPTVLPGRCTMHATRVDLAPALAKLGYIANPPTANVFVSTPNHSPARSRRLGHQPGRRMVAVLPSWCSTSLTGPQRTEAPA